MRPFLYVRGGWCYVRRKGVREDVGEGCDKSWGNKGAGVMGWKSWVVGGDGANDGGRRKSSESFGEG